MEPGSSKGGTATLSEDGVSPPERKKTDLYQELGLQARDLRFQHLMSISTRNNRIILRMEVSAPPTPPWVLRRGRRLRAVPRVHLSPVSDGRKGA